ncbi:phage major capsid protein [Caloranaerobacter ferrireducens]|uniref:phage major capsid protein n=1 Tax=Caloranaerobacter ferrireducens TaxID=1323370 RepID=UPI00084D6145|nr:phage major capsid protein [Caloranaerobacter ferrireducens]
MNKKIREMLDKLEEMKTEVRSLMNEDKVEEAEKKMEEVRALQKKIELEKQLLEEEKREIPEVDEVKEEREEQNQEEEYRNVFYKFIRGTEITPEEKRVLSVGTAASGGYTVPQSFQKKLIQKLEELNIMRKLANVIRTDSDTDIPIVVSHGSAAWTAEGAAYNESDETFGQITIKAYKLTRIIKVTEELLNDSAFDLENYLVNEFARSIAKAEESAFINGDGTDKPEGVFVGADVGVTAASSSAITADEIIDLYYALPRAYRDKAVWIMNDATAKAIRKLKDSNGDYLWEKGFGSEPNTILGRPVYTSEFAPTFGVNAKVIAFGDMSYYTIADRQTRSFQRLNELYAANGQVGFRVYERVDGKLTLSEAVKVLQMAAV